MNQPDPSSPDAEFIAQFADEPVELGLPPFGIMDLMMLTAGMAIAFAIYNQMVALGWMFSSEALWFKATMGVSFCLASGLSLASVYRFVIQKKATGRFLIEPGHWLLLVALVWVAGNVVGLGLVSFLPATGGNSGVYAWLLPYTAAGFIGSVVFLWGAIRVAGWWKAVFVANVLLHLVEFAQSLVFFAMFTSDFGWAGDPWHAILGWVLFGIQLLSSLGLLVVVIKELVKGPRRDLWHWFGALALFITHAILPVLVWVYTTFLFDPTSPI